MHANWRTVQWRRYLYRKITNDQKTLVKGSNADETNRHRRTRYSPNAMYTNDNVEVSAAMAPSHWIGSENWLSAREHAVWLVFLASQAARGVGERRVCIRLARFSDCAGRGTHVRVVWRPGWPRVKVKSLLSLGGGWTTMPGMLP